MDDLTLSSQVQQKKSELKSLRRELFDMGIIEEDFVSLKKEEQDLIELIKEVRKEINSLTAARRLNKENFTKSEKVLEFPNFLRTFA